MTDRVDQPLLSHDESDVLEAPADHARAEDEDELVRCLELVLLECVRACEGMIESVKACASEELQQQLSRN